MVVGAAIIVVLVDELVVVTEDDEAALVGCASETVVALLAVEISVELVAIGAAIVGVLIDVLVVVGRVVVEGDEVARVDGGCVANVAIVLADEVKLVVVLVSDIVLVAG